VGAEEGMIDLHGAPHGIVPHSQVPFRNHYIHPIGPRKVLLS